MTYNTGCPYWDDWFELCDSEDYPISNEVRLMNKLILLKIKEQGIKCNVEKVTSILELIEAYRPYKLTPVQKFLHSIPYTYYPDGTRVWNQMFILCGRGFGKNSFVSDFTFGAVSNRNGIPNYNVDIVATSENQAKTSFMDIYDTIGDNPELLLAYKRTKTEITFKKTHSTIKYHTSNAKTKDGLRPGCVVFDEIHEYDDYANIKVFRSALGKVPEKLTIYITTEGNVRGKVLDDYKNEAMEDLQTQNIDTKMFSFMAKIDDIEEFNEPDAWIKANPMLPYLPTLKETYMDDYKDALRRPSLKLEFILKRLNYVIEDVTHAVASWDDIRATNQSFDWESLDGCECIGGVDYASIRDFICVGLLFKKGEKYIFKHHTFIVEESLRLANFKLDIERAKFEGLVTIVPGATMNREFLTQWFLNEVKEHRYQIKHIATDSYRKAYLDEDFTSCNLPLTEVRSGPISHGKISSVVEALFSEHNLIFGDDMMMRWYTNNVKVETDAKGNKTYKKIEPITRKTDGFMAFIHSLIIALDKDKGLVSGSHRAIYDTSLKSYSY